MISYHNSPVNVLASSSDANSIVCASNPQILLDAGLLYKKLLKKLEFNIPKHCLITHEHKDHSNAIQDIIKHTPINIYTSQGTAEKIGITKYHRLHICKHNTPFKIENITITPFETIHDAKEPLGFVIETDKMKILFAVDTAYLKYNIRNLTHIAAECNYDIETLKEKVKQKKINFTLAKRITQTHQSAEELKIYIDKIDKSRLKEIHLLHKSNNNLSDKKVEQIFKKYKEIIYE